MSCEEMTVQVLKESGHRLTPQRLMVVSAVRHAEGHISASDIANSIKETYPYIDTSTAHSRT